MRMSWLNLLAISSIHFEWYHILKSSQHTEHWCSQVHTGKQSDLEYMFCSAVPGLVEYPKRARYDDITDHE